MRVRGKYHSGAPSFDVLAHQLDLGIPVIVGYRDPSADVGHAVVVTAVIYEATSHGPRIVRVMIRDPWPTYAQTLGKRILEAEEWAHVEQYYIISVTRS